MNNKEIESLLYSYDDWKSVAKKWPYCFEIEKNGQSLYYFGANHSHDPNNEQFPILQEFSGKFLEKTTCLHSLELRRGKENAVVFAEGGLRKVSTNEEETIKLNSESGLITWLANEASVPVTCPEPNPEEERIALLEKFSKDEIQYYYFARVTHAWHRSEIKSDFEKYITHFLQKDKIESKWEDFDFSLENMKRVHKDIFATDFNENEDRFSYINPTLENSVINNVAIACSTYRNVHIVSEILKFWQPHSTNSGQAGKNIFVVFGGSHAVL